MAEATGFDVLTPTRCLSEAQRYLLSLPAYQNTPPAVADRLRWCEGSNTPHANFQRHFLKGYPFYLPDAASLPELMSKVHTNVRVVNQWLRDNDFGEIQLTEIPEHPDIFHLAALYRLMLKYVVAGTEEDEDGHPYRILGKPAYHLKVYDGPTYETTRQIVKFLDIGQQSPLMIITTDSPNTNLVIAPAATPLAGLDLIDFASEMRSKIDAQSRQVYDFEGTVMPNLRLKKAVPEGKYFEGIHMTMPDGRDCYVQESCMAIEFQLGPEGVQAGAAAAMTLVLESYSPPRPNLVVDYDAVMFLMRPNMRTPLVTAYVPVEAHSNTVVRFNT